MSSDWLPDYCLYMAIKEANGMVDWQQWPRALRVREPEALAEFKAEHAEEIEFWAFLQYEFDRQWRAARLRQGEGRRHHGRYSHLCRRRLRRRLGRP